MTISLVLLLAAFILFVLAACGVGARFNLQAAGLAFWVLSVLLNGTHILRAAAIVGLVLILSGCSTTGPNPATNERNAGINAAGSAALVDAGKILGSVATSLLFEKAQGEIGGSLNTRDLAQSAGAAVWSQVNSQNIFGGIQDTVSAFSAGKLKQTALEAQNAADAALANGRTPTEVSNAVATVISTAAGAPPAK